MKHICRNLIGLVLWMAIFAMGKAQDTVGVGGVRGTVIQDSSHTALAGFNVAAAGESGGNAQPDH